MNVPLVDAELTQLDAVLFGVRWADAGSVASTFLVEYFSLFYLSYFAVLLGYAVPRALLGSDLLASTTTRRSTADG